MKPVILILKGKKPEIVNVAEGATSLRWNHPDDTEIELEITTARISSITGDASFYLIATDMDDLDSRQIRQAVDTLSLI
ncbi:hypothetical protein QCJ66_000935 [Enterobacter ludwigii]|nr:hypothetical protein [Enterobacter ludwigii]